jgi:hypothetical protein
MQMTFLNNIRKVGRLVLSRTSCILTRLDYIKTEDTRRAENKISTK